QPVQTFTRLGAPSIRARTRWMFGFQRRFVRRCECETFMPNEGFFPQSSQTEAMLNILLGPDGPVVEPRDHCSIASDEDSLDAVGQRPEGDDDDVRRAAAKPS